MVLGDRRGPVLLVTLSNMVLLMRQLLRVAGNRMLPKENKKV